MEGTMKLNDNIRIARTNKGITIEELSKMIGISVSSLRKYESGEIANIPNYNIRKIASALKVSEMQLKEGVGTESSAPPVNNAKFNASVVSSAPVNNANFNTSVVSAQQNRAVEGTKVLLEKVNNIQKQISENNQGNNFKAKNINTQNLQGLNIFENKVDIVSIESVQEFSEEDIITYYKKLNEEDKKKVNNYIIMKALNK